jgi:hypothetical protein
MDQLAPSVALCLLKSEDLQNSKVPELWAKLNSIPFSEASRHIRTSWGILSSSLTLSEAERLLHGLAKEGIGSRIVPPASLPVPPPMQAVKSLFFSSDALGIRAQSEEALYPWMELKGIFSFALTETTSVTTKKKEGPSAGAQIAQAGIFLATGMPIPMGKKKTEEKTEKRSELMFYLDLLFGNPWRRFRIDGQHLDYSILGPKKEMAAQSNFRILFEEISSRAPEAFLNKGSRIFRARQPVASMGYEDFADINREMSWYLAVC